MKLKTYKTFFEKWELRSLIIISLLLQIILVVSGNRRKRSSSKVVTSVLWLAYLSADWVATYSLGLISNTMRESNPYHNKDMLAFWTPFLLLHLGGPDTITALSVEDSQLWLRHGFSLILQFIAAGYIFTVSMGGSKLLYPTMCVLVAGALKYGERTWALKKSSIDGLRGSLVTESVPGPDYVQVMDVLSSDLFAGKPGMLNVKKEFDESKVTQSIRSETVNSSTERSNQVQLLCQAYFFFQTYKQLFVDLVLSFHDRDVSLSIFQKVKSYEAYKLIEIELNFIFDVLYTKAPVVHKFQGRVLRVFSFSSTLAAFILFFFVEKSEFQKSDKIVSYVLLGGALCLEILSLGLFIFSDWTIIILRNSKYNQNYSLKWLEFCIFQILSKFRPPQKPRWSHSVGQCSFLRFCANDRPTCFRKILDSMGVKELWDEYWYIEHTNELNEVKRAIYKDLYNKSKLDLNLNNCRGDQALGQEAEGWPLLKWSVEVDFDESLLLWHLATEICFHRAKKSSPNSLMSKVLSEYMLYLLIVRPIALSSTAGLGLSRYQDTMAEAKIFFQNNEWDGDESKACKMLLNAHTYVPASEVKGDRSKSVLWDAVQLAKELKELDEEHMWKIVCNVWIEMLCFAARHCRGYYHAQLLCVGGELLSIVWLLEIHLGMGLHYQIKSGHFMTRYKEDA